MHIVFQFLLDEEDRKAEFARRRNRNNYDDRGQDNYDRRGQDNFNRRGQDNYDRRGPRNKSKL